MVIERGVERDGTIKEKEVEIREKGRERDGVVRERGRKRCSGETEIVRKRL